MKLILLERSSQWTVFGFIGMCGLITKTFHIYNLFNPSSSTGMFPFPLYSSIAFTQAYLMCIHIISCYSYNCMYWIVSLCKYSHSGLIVHTWQHRHMCLCIYRGGVLLQGCTEGGGLFYSLKILLLIPILNHSEVITYPGLSIILNITIFNII